MKGQPRTYHKTIGKAILEEPDYIIAIGASAGGLEAIHEFFDNMTDPGNYSFVVIQHLSPDYKSLLVELVSKHTRMKVLEAEHNVVLQKRCVYIIPNNKVMTIKQGKVQLVQKAIEKAPNTAVDTFLYSLARDKGKRAIAVILSGTGSDGTRGVDAIKKAGGIVLVQSPDSARFDGMPNSAINGGSADIVLTPAAMPAEIVKHTRPDESYSNGNENGNSNGSGNGHASPPTQEELLQEITHLVKLHTGNDFHAYKPATILRRIEKQMMRLELHTMEEYLSYLTQYPEESNTLYKSFLIGVTRFFRDKQAYEVISKQVLPALVKTKQPGELLKIWVNACSTGEEAYSLAIVFERYLKEHDLQLDIKIFATDLDESAIEYAARGVYPLSIEKDIDKDTLEEYFVREGKKYMIIPRIRKSVVFARHNVLKDPPFIHNDLVSCRNMLIYMDNSLQEKVLDTLDFSLRVGGFLFLGSSEHLASLKENYAETEGKWKIFRKMSLKKRNYIEPVYNPGRSYRNMKSSRAELPLLLSSKKQEEHSLVEAFKDLMADESKYAALYIDSRYEVKDAIGEFTRYLALPERKLNFHLLKMLLPELSVPINTSIRKAWKEKKKVAVRAIRVKRGEQSVLVNAIINPFPPEKNPCTLLVMWETPDTGGDDLEAIRHQLSPDSQALILELEDELQESRSNLQIAVEGLETANEELQSSNEELLSANEELQSSNEELQSLNEELHTLNTEHQLKIRELIELNDDMNNYFGSTDMGQVFVDGDMHIRKFNPAAVKLINLIDSDIGRPIDHISNNIENSTLLEDIKHVLRSKKLVEKEVKLINRTSALMRIFPYIRSDKKTDGAVISFIDISMIKNLDNIITGIFNSTLNAIIAFKAQRSAANEIADFHVLTANKAADALLATNSETATGLSMKYDFQHLCSNGLFHKLVRVVEDNKVFHDECTLTTGEFPVTYEMIAVKMMDGIIITYSDITEKKEAEQQLRKSYSELVVAKDSLKQLNLELEEKVIEGVRANKELEKSNTELQQYAFVASHDLKEPTRKIFIFSNMIKDNYLKDTESKATDLVNRIIKSSQRMMRLIEDLLNYSRLSQNGVFEPVDLNVTIRDILSDLEVVISDKQAVVKMENLCTIDGMQGQIRQVFQNLVSNALKFTRKDIAPEVHIHAQRVATRSFDAFEDARGAYCRIEVSDNGIGFHERFLDKIFTLFQRLHTQEQFEGTGIGLAITRKIIEKHNGIITARSKEGAGTTFVIVLPMHQTTIRPI